MDRLPDLRDVWSETNPGILDEDVIIEWANGALARVHISEALEYVVTSRWPDGGLAGVDYLTQETSAYSGGLRVVNAYLAQTHGGDRLETDYPTVHGVLTMEG